MGGGLRPAHDLLTRLLVTLRLVAPDAQEPADQATCALIARALGLDSCGRRWWMGWPRPATR
ncbi:hypothetical protein AB5I41_13930 [Sphingomonas sp. MMS24-JH45]